MLVGFFPSPLQYQTPAVCRGCVPLELLGTVQALKIGFLLCPCSVTRVCPQFIQQLLTAVGARN